MTEPTRRIILDGVEFGQVFHFPKLLGSCTAALQPARLVIALLMVTLVITFGRIWDAATEPTVAPAGLAAGAWTPDDATHIQGALQTAMREFALDNEVPEAGEAWPVLHPREVLAQIRTGYRIRRDDTGPDVAVRDENYRETYAWITQRAPLGSFEATAKHVTDSFLSTMRGAVSLSPPEAVDGIVDFVVRLPMALWRHDRIFTLLLGLVVFLAYIVGGGALSRMAGCQVATGMRLGLDEAVDFALVHWIRFGVAVLLPVVLAVILAGVIAALGLLMLAPILDVIGAVAYGLALLIGFVLAFVLVGYAVGFGMILPAVACENCDGPDAGQKAYAFVFQRPLHLLGYLAVAFAGLVAGYLVVNLFALVMLLGTATLFGWSGHAAFDGAGALTWRRLSLGEIDPWAGGMSTGIVTFWQSVVITLVAAYVVSFLCDAATRLFLLMRRACDDQAIEEIWWPGMTPGTIAARPPAETAADAP